MTWKHIAAMLIGSAVAIGGAFTPASGALIPIGAGIITGALGHAQSDERKKGE